MHPYLSVLSSQLLMDSPETPDLETDRRGPPPLGKK